ncbi:MAG: tetratricopeptide repeat protein [Algicola sp.]|nr:tetratricopeptide repeat protein [Algicola sp.]
MSSTYSGLANAYAQGYYQFGKGELWLQQATDFAKRAIALQPEQAWGHKSLGFALYLSGQFVESIAAYHQASKLAPNWGVATAYRALAHLATGDSILAYQAARKAVEQSPTNPVTTAILGRCYLELGMVKQAKSALEKALEYDPDYPLAQSYVAELALLTSDYPQANSILLSMTKRSPDWQYSHWLTALLHLQTGETGPALQSFEQAALLGGRYRLPAQVYLAVIKKDARQLNDFYLQLNNQINLGNQWHELVYSKALISLANNNFAQAVTTFEQAINAGFSHEYRFDNLPLFSTLSAQPKFKQLLESLARKNKQKRLKRVPG